MENKIIEEWVKQAGFMWLSIKYLIPGLFGGILSVYKTHKRNLAKDLPQQTLFESFLTVSVWGLCSTFMTPLALEFVNISGDSQYWISFIIGYSGLLMMETVLSKIK